MRADRRRRGRAIRKARRDRRDLQPVLLTPERAAMLVVAVERAVHALRSLIPYLAASLRVAAYRMLPLIYTPRAGARRQLLHQGRAPRPGGR